MICKQLQKQSLKPDNFIQLGKEGNTLIISLVERPSIASIELDGNKALKTEDLLKGLDDAGLSEGQVFKRSIVNSLAIEIQRQYVSQGRYGAKVDVTTDDEPRNRVSLNIEIDEGEVAEIKTINIVGNSFSDEEILNGFELKPVAGSLFLQMITVIQEKVKRRYRIFRVFLQEQRICRI